MLQEFPLEKIMAEVEHISPTLCQLLCQIATDSKLNAREKVPPFNYCCAIVALWIPQHIVHILFDNRFGVVFGG
jgi:hypothetical protein